MNNYVKSILFFIFLVLFYLLIGDFILSKTKISRCKFTSCFLTGWIVTFSLGWIIGFPMQLFSLNWNSFNILFSGIIFLIYVLLLLHFYFKDKDKVKKILYTIKGKPYLLLNFFINHLKKYWFVYLLSILFFMFSITNLQSYTLNNYSDDHYITKMVHMIKSNALLSESQSTGEILKNYGKFSYALQQSQRMFNSYELLYTWFSSVFSIDMVFFARFTMTFHNYLVWFFSFQLLGSIFVEENYSQYTLIPFLFLLIPAGYAARGMKIISIHLFESWRNQTAMYMGGSIVRNTAFPLLLYLNYLFYDGEELLKKSLLLIFLCIVLISYQTTAISYILLFIPIFLIGLLLNYILRRYVKAGSNKKNKYLWVNIFTILIVVVLIFITNIDWITNKINITASQNFVNSISFNRVNLLRIYNKYIPYYNDAFLLDSFLKCALIVLLGTFVILKTNYKGKIITILVSFLYLIFKLNKMKLTLSLISFDFFCTARMLNSMELLIIFLCGVDIVIILNDIFYKLNKNKKRIIISFISLSFMIASVSFIFLNIDEILKYHKAADGVIKEGYSFTSLIENDKMEPKFITSVGKYFNALPNSKYRIFSFDYFTYKKLRYEKTCLLFSSKKLSFCPDWNMLHTAELKGDQQEINKINEVTLAYNDLGLFLTGSNNNYNYIDGLLKKCKINYAFFTKKAYVKKLCLNGWNIVSGSEKDGYWILKRS